MAERQVTVEGIRWTVWEVLPGSAAGSVVFPLRADLANGWLAIARPGEKRRIAPIPEGWREWSDEALAEAVRRAARVP